MQSLQSLLQPKTTKLPTTGLNVFRFKPTVTEKDIATEAKQAVVADNFQPVTALYDSLSSLLNPKFRAWYCQRFYQLGTQRVLELASIARADGHNKPKLFSLLLKRG